MSATPISDALCRLRFAFPSATTAVVLVGVPAAVHSQHKGAK